ncbi:hypothetical protein AB0N05_26640 [Nocardia sp. NPDC051030]|uniref:hypothetical protein n=1 Tax=Nocardia sp. NPDC051030 TaxID=3155162 RepID=UPI0034426CE7
MVGQGRHQRSDHGTIARQRPPVRIARPAHRRPTREAVFSAGWLLMELPTAVLLAVFVGTGWLGYVQHSGTPAQPRPAVVVPVDQPGAR